MRKVILLISFCVCCLWSWSQSQYWLELTDKGSISANSSSINQLLSENTLNRRLYFDLTVDITDLPLEEAYVEELKSLGAEVLHKSKWLNGIVMESTNPNFYLDAQEKPFVKRIVSLGNSKTLVSPKYNLEELDLLDESDSPYGFAITGIEMLNGIFLHDSGFLGQSIDIAVMDNGFQFVNTNRFFDSLNIQNKIHGVYNFVENTPNVFSEGDHGAYVMSTLAANIKDTLVGTAPQGNYYLFTTEDNNSEGLAEEINWALAAEWADSALGNWVVLSTSLGYSQGFSNPNDNHSYADMDGNTTIITKAADLAAKKGLLVINSAGNEGNDPWKYITAPADGDSVLAIGAVTAEREISSFSSFGPSADGRTKPNVSALGRRVAAAKFDGTIQSINGTSFACPITAGLAACLWQAFPDRGNMEIFKAIEQSAHLWFTPEDQMGFGIPDFKKAYDILSLNTVNKNAGILIYPNPSNDFLNVSFVEGGEGDYSLMIADPMGKVWFNSEELQSALVEQIDVGDLSNGVYFLFIQQGKERFRQKFVKR